MDILCKISESERDLIRVVVDVVSELREGDGDEEIDQVSHHPQHLVTVDVGAAKFLVAARVLMSRLLLEMCRLPAVPQDAGQWLPEA